MKKLVAVSLTICLLFCIAGCGTAKQSPPGYSQSDSTALTNSVDGPNSSVSASKNATETAPSMHAISLPSVKESVVDDDGVELCTLSFQRAQLYLNHSATEEQILGDLQTRMGVVLSLSQEIEGIAKEARPESEFWSPYFTDISYTPTRLDQAVLSLFGNLFSYSGGAHPSLMTDSVTYELQSGDVLYLDDILEPGCSADQLCQLILDALSSRAEDLYFDYEAAVRDRFTSDLHSIKDWYFSRTGLCFHFAPYDIAPYSSGTVIAEIPYSELEGSLQECYFPTSVENVTGSMYAGIYMEDSSEPFTRFANLSLADEGCEVLLYSDATVTDVRIEIGTRFSETEPYIAGSTVFAADAVHIGDAIRLTADFTDESTLLRLIYRSGELEHSAFITYDRISNSILLTNG